MNARSDSADFVRSLIPGDADFPAADAIDIHGAIAAHEYFGPVLIEIHHQLPDGFCDLSEEAKLGALREIEVGSPDLFRRVVVAVYSLYYTHPAVAAAIEKLTGHAVRAPQPEGYELAPFDPVMVAVPARSAPHYRPTPESNYDR
jgi:hypothetical protein